MATSAIGRLEAILELNAARFHKGLEKAQKRMKRFGRNMQRTGTEMSRNVTLPLALAGASILKVAGDFEQGMNKVQALTGATGKQFDQMSKQAKVLGRTTQFSAGQATEGMAFLAQAGFKADEIYQALPSTLNLAAAAQMDMGRSADIVSNVMQGFGLEADQTERAVDVMSKAFTSSNTNLEQLGQAMKFAGGVARGLGFSLEETTAALGLLGNAGIQAGIAGRGLRTALADIASEKPKIEDFANKFNISFKNADGTLRSITEIVRQMNEAGVESTDIYSTFSKQAATVFDTLRQQGAPALQQFTQQLRDSGGVAQRIAETQMKGFNGAMRELRSALEGAAIAIAEGGLLEWATNFGKQLAAMFRDLARVNPEILKWGTLIAGVAAAAGPLIAALGFVTIGLTAFGGALLGPVGVVAALTTTVAGFIAFNKDIRAIVAPLWRDMVAGFKGMMDGIDRAMDATSEIFPGFVNDTTSMGDSVLEALAFIVDGFRSGFKVIASSFQALGRTLGAGGAQIMALIQGRFGDIKRIGDAWQNDMAGIFKGTFEEFNASAARTGLAAVRMKESTEQAAEGIKSVNEQTIALGDNSAIAVQGLKDIGQAAGGAGEEIDGATDSMSEFQSFTENFQTDAQRIEQFRKKLEFLNEQFQSGAIGINRYNSEVTSLTSSISDLVSGTDGAKQATVELSDEFKTALSGAEQQIKDQRRIWDNLIDGVQGAWVGFFEDVFQGKGIKSIKDFLGRVKDLFFRLIAEIAAKWTAAKIFGGSFNIGNISISGGANLASSIAANIGLKGLGSKIAGALKGGGALGAVEAGTGATASSFGGLSVIGPQLGVLAAPFIARELFGGGNIDKMLNKFQGFQGQGPLGTRIGVGGKNAFVGGPNQGFAGDFAKSQGKAAFTSEALGITAIKNTGLNELVEILQQAQDKFEQLKVSAADTFELGENGAARVGKALQDGFIDQTELANLGFRKMGERIVHAETGAVSLGRVTASQFDKIIAAVKRGEIRMRALKGEVDLNKGEMQALGQIGLSITGQISEGAEAAAKSFGKIRDAINSIPSEKTVTVRERRLGFSDGQIRGGRSFAVGSPYIPHDMVAQIHQGERIFSRTDNEALIGAINNLAQSGGGNGKVEVHVHGDEKGLRRFVRVESDAHIVERNKSRLRDTERAA